MSVFILLYSKFSKLGLKVSIESTTLSGMWKALLMNWFHILRNSNHFQIDHYSEKSKLLFLLQTKVISMSLT